MDKGNFSGIYRHPTKSLQNALFCDAQVNEPIGDFNVCHYFYLVCVYIYIVYNVHTAVCIFYIRLDGNAKERGIKKPFDTLYLHK